MAIWEMAILRHFQTASWVLEVTGLREHFTFADNVVHRADSRPPRP